MPEVAPGIQRWAAPQASNAARPGGGQDHLGLNGIDASGLLAQLLPNINVLTVHPRYQSFYLFLLDEYWRRGEHRASAKGFSQFLRPREYFHSLANFYCQQPTHPVGDYGSVIGSRRTSGWAKRRDPIYPFRENYIGNALGGYGYYYRSVALGLDLIAGPKFGSLPLDKPTKRGAELAEAFREAVHDTEYIRKYFDADEVPREVIEEYAQVSCLCRTSDPATPDQRPLLDAFTTAGLAANARRAGLRTFLDIADQTDGHSLDDERFRQLIYFGRTDDGATYRATPKLAKEVARWRVWQAREYLSVGLSAIFALINDWGVAQGGVVRALPLAALWDHLRIHTSFGELSRDLGPGHPAIELDSAFATLVDWQAKHLNLGSPDLPDSLGEHRLAQLLRFEPRSTTRLALAGLLLVTAIGRRWREADAGEEFFDAGGGDDISIRQIGKWVQSASERRITVGDALRELCERVIRLHLNVALSKLPEDRFRFFRELGGFRFGGFDIGVGFVSSRYLALATHAHELALCGDPSLPIHPLTNLGLQFLKEA